MTIVHVARSEVVAKFAAASGCAQLTDGNFAVAADDEGHEGGGFTATAFQDPELKAVFGYTSEHQLALVSKALIKAFYGSAPADSYFDGCSDGGREALIEAQRYPTDFNGIVAGSPCICISTTLQPSSAAMPPGSGSPGTAQAAIWRRPDRLARRAPRIRSCRPHR